MLFISATWRGWFFRSKETATSFAMPMPGHDAALRTVATLQPAPRLMSYAAQTCSPFTAFCQAMRYSAPTLQHLIQRSLLDTWRLGVAAGRLG